MFRNYWMYKQKTKYKQLYIFLFKEGNYRNNSSLEFTFIHNKSFWIEINFADFFTGAKNAGDVQMFRIPRRLTGQ